MPVNAPLRIYNTTIFASLRFNGVLVQTDSPNRAQALRFHPKTLSCKQSLSHVCLILFQKVIKSVIEMAPGRKIDWMILRLITTYVCRRNICRVPHFRKLEIPVGVLRSISGCSQKDEGERRQGVTKWRSKGSYTEMMSNFFLLACPFFQVAECLPSQWFSGLKGQQTLPQLEPFCRYLVHLANSLYRSSLGTSDVERRTAK